MVETLTSKLEIESRKNILTPTIIETKQSQVGLIKQKLRDRVPFEELGTGTMAQIGEGLRKNILGKFQGSLVSFKQIPSFNMIAVPLFRDLVEEFADMREVDTMYYDKPMQTLQYPTVDERGVYNLPRKDFKFTSTAWTKNLMGADRANQQGFSGQGMKTSIPDTGANRTHEAVRGKIHVKSMMRDKGQYKDKNGHGLWCTACVGGRSAVDNTIEPGIPTEGMAPRTDLLSLKVLGYVMGTGMTSDIVQSMEYSWKQGADVVSMSLGGPASKDPAEDPECQVISRLKDEMTFVVAAGNSGPDEGTVGSPGICPNALTIGAFNPITGEIADFSSRGPTPDGRTKPDVVAPGVNTHSPILGVLDGAGDNRTNRFSPISGTSMATPHTAGLVTLMKQAKRSLVGEDMSTEEIKEMMKELGKDKNNTRGYGFLNWSKFEEWMSTEYNFDLTKGKPEAPPEEVPPEQGEESEQQS